MAQLDNTQKQINSAVEMGRKNQGILPRVQAWCSHLKLVDASGGMVAAMYRIPLSVNISCPHASGGYESMQLESMARDFIIEYCENCSFHSPTNAINFGTDVFRELNAFRERQRQAELQEVDAKKQLKESIKKLLDQQKTVADIPEVSILKLIESLEVIGNQKETAEKLNEASLLQPLFFTDIALDVLATYFTDKNISAECLQIVSNILLATNKYPESCIRKAIEVIKDGDQFDKASIILKHFVNAETIQGYKSPINSLFGRLRYERFPGEPFGEKEYPNAEVFFAELLKSHEQFLLDFFTEQLLINDKSHRINTVGLLENLVAANPEFGLKLLPTLIKTLELEDDQYMTSADKVTCFLIAKVVIAIPNPAYKALEAEKVKLSLGGKVAHYSIYDKLLQDKHFIINNPEITEYIISDLLKTGLDKSNDETIRDEAIDALYNAKENLAGLGSNYFSQILLAFRQLVEERSAFKWYVKEIETKKVSTFNPLAGRNAMDVHHLELKLNSYREHIKACLIEVIKASQPVYIPQIFGVLFPLDTKNNEYIKKEFISLVRSSCTDPLLLSRFIPKLYNYLFDPDDKTIRVEAIRFLDHLVSSVPQVITSTLHDVVEIFLSDDDPEIRGETVSVLESMIEAAGENPCRQQIQNALKALADRTIFVHKKALPICHDLAPHLDETMRMAFYLELNAILPHYESKQEFDTCRQIVNCILAISGSEIRLVDFTVKQYIIRYCDVDDLHASRDFLHILNRIKLDFPQYRTEWFKSALSYLKRSEPDRYNPSFDPRVDIFEEIYSYTYEEIVQNELPLFETAKQIASRSPHDAVNFLFILSHFELHGLCINLCNQILETVPTTKSTQSLLEFVSRIKQYSAIESQIRAGRIELSVIQKLENETKKTN